MPKPFWKFKDKVNKPTHLERVGLCDSVLQIIGILLLLFPVFVEANVIGGHGCQNLAAQLQYIHRAERFVQNFAVGTEQYGVRNSRLPLGIEGRLQACSVV